MSAGNPGTQARVFWAVFFASALCVVLATRVFVSFDALRVKLIRVSVPAADGNVRIETASDARAARLDSPVALVAVIHNPGDADATFSIAADGEPVCAVELSAHSRKRVDCVVSGSWTRAPSHTLLVSGPPDGWALDFLEISTHHGSSSRLLPFFVLPDAATIEGAPSWFTVGFAWFVLLGLLVARPARWPSMAVKTHRVALSVLTMFLVAAVLSSWVSKFLLVMPIGTFVVICGLLLAPRLHHLAAASITRVTALSWSKWLWRPGVAVAGIAVLVAGAYALVIRYSVGEFQGNYSGLIRISEEGFDRSPLFAGRTDVRESLALSPNEGYDAQFMYFAAFDPFLRKFHDEPRHYRDVVDAPPYRFGRIGLPLMVRAVAGDKWSWYPAVMIGLVLLGAAVSAAVLARLAQQSGMSPLWGLVVLAFPGFWQSVRVVLPEPLAAATMLLGYLCVVHRRVALATVLLAASLLIRETGAVLVVALVALLPSSVMAWRERRWLLASVVPLVTWRLYVAAGLWSDWGWESLFYASNNVSVPFLGIGQLWASVMAGTYHPTVPSLATAAVWFPLLLGLVAVVAISLRHRLARHLTVAFGAYALMALSLTPKVWSHVANAQRTSYEAFVLLALASVSVPAATRRQRGLILACWVASALVVLFGSFDSGNIRAALFPW
jgi:hypothetical protein